LQLLNRVRWLSDAGRTQLATEGRLIRLRARQAIYSERSTADRVFFLLAGIAKIYTRIARRGFSSGISVRRRLIVIPERLEDALEC
jgi:hypothetical protein